MDKLLTYIKSILVPVIVGAVVGIITSPAMDYNNLQKPPLSPPGGAFPIVWTILYILMGVSYGILKSKGHTNEKIDVIYYLQLAVNALWSIFFFSFEWRLFAFLWILLLDVLVVIMVYRFNSKNKLAGLLQIPYLMWIIFATYLNFSFYILNR